MRYIVLSNGLTQEEIYHRKVFIEKSVGVYFISKPIDGGIEFTSIPSTLYDCIMIVGHNGSVKRYILSNSIPERNIVIVSCLVILNKTIAKKKNIYVSFNNEGITNFYDGKEWNLNFNISQVELKLINGYENIMTKIEKNFRRIFNG